MPDFFIAHGNYFNNGGGRSPYVSGQPNPMGGRHFFKIMFLMSSTSLEILSFILHISSTLSRE